MAERGVIEHEERARQIRDFSGLRYGNITPTDIDGLIDFKNRIFVVFELKYMDAKTPFGQHLAIERIVDIVQETGRVSIGIIGRHEHHDVNEPIDCANADLVEYRWLGEWREPKRKITVKQAIDKITEGLI